MYGIVSVRDKFFFPFGIEAGIKIKTVTADIPLNDWIELNM